MVQICDLRLIPIPVRQSYHSEQAFKGVSNASIKRSSRVLPLFMNGLNYTTLSNINIYHPSLHTLPTGTLFQLIAIF